MATRDRPRDEEPRAGRPDAAVNPAPSRRARPSDRRASAARRPRTALSLDAIVARARAILDAEGVEALTLRRLARELDVGAASMYWYVDDKDELLDLCYLATVEGVTRDILGREIDLAHWQDELRAICADLFDLIQQHPWVADLQSHGTVATRIWDRIGGTLDALGLDKTIGFYASSLLAGHLGSTGLEAARIAYGTDAREDREARLARRATEIESLDPVEYPFVSRLAPIFRNHTERDQFLGGVDIILAGIATQVPRQPPAARG